MPMKPVPLLSSWSRKFRTFFGHWDTAMDTASLDITSSSDSFTFLQILSDSSRMRIYQNRLKCGHHCCISISIYLAVCLVYCIISLTLVSYTQKYICSYFVPCFRKTVFETQPQPVHLQCKTICVWCMCNLCSLMQLAGFGCGTCGKDPCLARFAVA